MSRPKSDANRPTGALRWTSSEVASDEGVVSAAEEKPDMGLLPRLLLPLPVESVFPMAAKLLLVDAPSSVRRA